jgi:protein SCO1/2
VKGKVFLFLLLFCTAFNRQKTDTEPKLPVDPLVVPEKFQGKVDLVEKLGNQLPLDIVFYNHRGERVELGRYFDGKRPVVLNLVYYNCPSICNEILNSLSDTMRALSAGDNWKIGRDYRVLTVSIDPRESYGLAYRKRTSYIEYYGEAVAHDAWTFFTGNSEDINLLADAVGFKFYYHEDLGQYVHSAATILLSPEGQITRYLPGTYVSPMNLKFALVESGQGKVGSSFDRALLRWCYSYDPKEGGYSLRARQVMTAGGAMTLIVVGTFMFVLWRKEVRRGDLK